MAENHLFEGTLEWAGQPPDRPFDYAGYERSTRLAFAGGATVDGSAPPQFHGDATRMNPETLMLGSLMQCHFLTFMAVAAKSGARVLAYSDRAEGTLGMHEGKMRFVSVTLRPKVTLADPKDLARLEAFHHKAHANCFMSNSVAFPVTVAPDLS